MRFSSFNRTRISFVAGCLCAVALVPPVLSENAGATVTGVVQYNGTVPSREHPDNEGRNRPKFDVDKSGGLANAVAYLVPVDGAVLKGGSAPRTPVEITQEDGEFVPRVVAVRAGQKISITNSEPANHNVRSVTTVAENQFNIMTAFDDAYEHVIQNERTGRPILLLCDIHPWMIGWIFVFDHDLFAVTDVSGRFAIKAVPPGKYVFHVYQPGGALNASGEVSVASENISATVKFGEKDLGSGEAAAIRFETERS